MKKRLLSALLAMVMVLAMLPMSAFAANTPTGDDDGATVYYYAKGAKFSGTETAENASNAGWYSRTQGPGSDGKNYYTYSALTSGVVCTLNNSGSAVYYQSVGGALAAKKSSLMLLSDATNVGVGDILTSSLSINMNGHALSFSGDTGTGKDKTTGKLDEGASTYAGRSFNSLTITDTATTKGVLGGSIGVQGKSFRLSLTGTNNASNSLAVTLDNSTDTVDTATAKTSLTLTITANGAKMGDVTTKNAKANVTVSNQGEVGEITVGDTDDCSTRTGATVTVGTRSVTGDVNIYGTGTINVSGNSTVSDVTLYGGAMSNNEADTSKVPSWKGTTLTADGASTVGSITQAGGDMIGHTVTIKGGSHAGAVELEKGGTSTLNVQGGSDVGAVKMAHGKLDVNNGTVTSVAISAGGDDTTNNNKGAMTITVSDKNSVVGDITPASSLSVTPAVTVNAGTVGDVKGDATLTVNGGTIGRKVESSELNASLRGGWQIKDGTKYTYTTNFQDLIDAYQAATGTKPTIEYVGATDVTGAVEVTFRWNDDTEASSTILTVVTIAKDRVIELPTKVQEQTVNYWFDSNDTANKGIPAGSKYPITEKTTLTVRQSQVGTNLVTAITAKEKGGQNIGCTVSGTTINLSGALQNVANGGDVEIFIEIDGDKTEANLRKVSVAWSANGGLFVSSVNGTGVTRVGDTDNQIKVYDTIYTITGNGLSNVKDRIKITDTLTQLVSVPNASAGLSGTYAELGKVIKEVLETSEANFTNANGILAQLNSMMNGLSQSTIDGYIRTACNAQAAHYNKEFNLTGTNATKGETLVPGCEVILTPYLELSFSNWTPVAGKNPTATLNITPKYRYTVVKGSTPIYKDKDKDGNEIPWEQTGNLTVSGGDYGNVAITLKMPASTFSDTTNPSRAHHNGYVYAVGWTVTDNVASSNFTVVNGFSPFNLNNEDGVAYISKDGNAVASPAYTFETLQQAVDATVNSDTVMMRENYNGPIDMSGAARNITIKKAGDNSVYITGVSGANSTFDTKEVGSSYTVQLTTNTTAPSGSVSILQGSFSNGTMTFSTSKANANSQVTVNLTPASGYVVNNVTAKTNTGANVALTATGTANQYTFTVPSGATSVTVTPTFAASGVASVIVNSTAYGTATTSAAGGTVQTGSTVTVYLTPNAGCRTIGLTVRTNSGSSVYVNQVNTNQYTFTVPGGATSVTVTPSFDRDTGMPFLDVLSTDAYLASVQYAYNHSLVNGTTSTTFSGYESITRAQIVTILYRLSNSPAVTGSSSFVDVPAGVYAAPVAWAQANGVVTGTSPTTFEPDRAITRQELATILYRYHVNVRKLAATNLANLGSYTDRSQVAADWAMTPVQWCVGNGIITGTTPTTLEPNGTAIRYHAATMLTRYCQNILGIQ